MLQQLGQLKTQKMVGNLANVKEAFGFLKSVGNPQALLNKAMSKNPQLKSLIDECGGDYKKAFYRAAEMQGVNPEEFLNELMS